MELFLRYSLTCLLLTIFISGCTKLGPDFKPPEMKLSNDWLTQDKTTFKRGDYRHWWKVFNDPILDHLIELAYRQNLGLQTAAMRIQEARAQLGIARGNLYPQQQGVGGALNVNKLSENMPNFETTDDPTYAGFQAGFDALWEVDIWGRYRRSIESANAALAASALDYDDILVSLTAEVAASYTLIRAFQQRLVLARQNQELQEKSVHMTEVRFRDEIGTDLDVQQAMALMHNTRALIASLEAGLQQTQNALCTLLGQQPYDLSRTLGNSNTVPVAAKEVVVGVPADILRRRPDVRREELKAAAQSALIGVAKAELYPRFSLRGALGLSASTTGSNSLLDIFDIKSLAGTFGPTVSWPIFNYGRLENNVKVQEARYDQLLIGYRNSVLRAAREVEDAMISFLKARQQVTSYQNSVDASERAVAIALSQFRNGIEDYTRVLISQQALVQQQDKLIVSQGDSARQLIALYKALGGGWEIRQAHRQVSQK